MTPFYLKRRQSPILGEDAFRRRLRLKGRPIDVPELRAARPRPGPRAIVATVARHFEVRRNEIWKPRRSRRTANPARGMAMYLCQHLGDMKLAEIARLFGLSHYASASAGIRQFRARLQEDRKLQKALNTIKLDLTP